MECDFGFVRGWWWCHFTETYMTSLKNMGLDPHQCLSSPSDEWDNTETRTSFTTIVTMWISFLKSALTVGVQMFSNVFVVPIIVFRGDAHLLHRVDVTSWNREKNSLIKFAKTFQCIFLIAISGSFTEHLFLSFTVLLNIIWVFSPRKVNLL